MIEKAAKLTLRFDLLLKQSAIQSMFLRTNAGLGNLTGE